MNAACGAAEARDPLCARGVVLVCLVGAFTAIVLAAIIGPALSQPRRKPPPASPGAMMRLSMMINPG